MTVALRNLECAPGHIHANGDGRRREQLEQSPRAATDVEDPSARGNQRRRKAFPAFLPQFLTALSGDFLAPYVFVEDSGGALDRPASHLLAAQRRWP